MKDSKAEKSSVDLKISDMHRIPRHERVKVKLSDIAPESFEGIEFDPIFDELYRTHLIGECYAAYTRMSIARITPGFLRRDSEGNLQHVQDPINDRLVRYFTEHIRAGERPSPLVYSNRFPAHTQIEFLCPDDANLYEAYRLLGIEKIPVKVLDPKESDFEESAIYGLRCSVPDDSSGVWYIHHVHRADFDMVESFLGASPPDSFDTAAKILIDLIEEASERLRRFHLSGVVDLHYHHTLSSVLFRLKQTILGMQMLLRAELHCQALTLLRTMYELVLFFYIDWLAPQVIGPWLQRSAVSSKQEVIRQMEAYYEEKRAEGWDDATVDTLQKANRRTYDLVSKVIEKARLNPLSSQHKDLYRYLSSIVHQDFTMTARYAHTLEDEMHTQDDEAALANLITFADVLTAQVVTRITSDTGDLKQGFLTSL
jgi:hypothetical protein